MALKILYALPTHLSPHLTQHLATTDLSTVFIVSAFVEGQGLNFQNTQTHATQ